MKYFYKADDANQRELAPGVKLKTMWGDKIMMSLVELDPGSEVPLHSHTNEQAGMVLEGEFEFTIGTESKKVKEGEYYIIPGGIEHRVVAGSQPARGLQIIATIQGAYLNRRPEFLNKIIYAPNRTSALGSL